MDTILLKTFVFCVGNLTEISTCEKQKNRENTRQRKQSNAQDNIYVVRQFLYVHRVVEILLLSGKKRNIRCGYNFFLS